MDAASGYLDALADAIALTRSACEHDHVAAAVLLSHGDAAETADCPARMLAALLAAQVGGCPDCRARVLGIWQEDVRAARMSGCS